MPGSAVVLLGLCAAEVCLTGTADTLTLPLFLYREKKKDRERDPDANAVTVPCEFAPEFSAGFSPVVTGVCSNDTEETEEQDVPAEESCATASD